MASKPVAKTMASSSNAGARCELQAVSVTVSIGSERTSTRLTFGRL
jgi:hypothetical protein